MCTEKSEPQGFMRLNAWVGERKLLHCTGFGKALLMHFRLPIRDRYRSAQASEGVPGRLRRVNVAAPKSSCSGGNRTTQVGNRRVLPSVAVLINYIDRGNLSIVCVTLMKDFGISPVSLGTLLSAFFWTYTLLQIPVGFVVDRFGLKWAYAAAFLLWSLGHRLLWALRHRSGRFWRSGCSWGVGESVAQPASLAYIRQNFDEDQQGLPSARHSPGMMIGPATGAFVGAAMLESIDWRSLFIYTGLGGVVWLIPWLWLMPQSSKAQTEATCRRCSQSSIRLVKIAEESYLLGYYARSILLFLFLVFLSDMATGVSGSDARTFISEDGGVHGSASYLHGDHFHDLGTRCRQNHCER